MPWLATLAIAVGLGGVVGFALTRAHARVRGFVDIMLVISFAAWLVDFLVGLRHLFVDLPYWASDAWIVFGPAVVTVLVVGTWNSPTSANGLTHPGERALLIGFTLWCVVFVVLGMPILGTLALTLLAPIAFAAIAGGVYQARAPTAPLHRQGIALAFIVLGLGALIWSSEETGRLAYQWAHAMRPRPLGYPTRGHVPPPAAWMWNAVAWFVPALLWGMGLRFWTSWSAARCVAWALIVLGIPPAILLVFRLVLLTNPPLGT